MNFIKYSLSVIFLIGLIACGKISTPQSGSDVKRKVNRGELSEARQNWNISESSCDGVSLATDSQSYYIFSKDLIARVNSNTDTAELLCKTVIAYYRRLSVFHSDTGAYTEAGVLTAASAKKTCWKKNGGSTIGSRPTTTTIPFAQESLPYELSGIDGIMVLKLKNTTACPGELLLKLQVEL